MKKQFRTAAWLVTVFVAGMLLPEFVHSPNDRVDAVAARRGGGRVPLSSRIASAASRRSYTAGDGIDSASPVHPFKVALSLSLGVLKQGELDLAEAELLADAVEAEAAALGVQEGVAVEAAPIEDASGKKKMIIGVLTDPYSLGTIGLAAFSTWGQEAQQFATVIFFVGSCQADTSSFPGTVVCLDTPDTYPPQRKVFLMWAHLWRHHANDYQWFTKVDHDTYVNVEKMRGLLHVLSSAKYSQQCSYVGLPALGRAEEAKKLGLSGRPYCSGLGYTINLHCMTAVGPNFGGCFDGTVSNHSDTEFGRCIMKHADAECTGVSGYSFKQIYYQQSGDMVFPMKLVSGGQMTLVFQKEPKATHFGATLLHPLKRAEDFYRFHKQSTSGLRPVQPHISDKSEPSPYQMASADLRQSCVHNPQRQKAVTGVALPECKSCDREEPSVSPTVAYVLTQEGSSSRESFDETATVLSEAGIRAVQIPIPGWSGPATGHAPRGAELPDSESTDGAQSASRLAYFAAIRSLLSNATTNGARRVMILEEHVMFSCTFKEQLWALLNSRRCTAHLFTKRRGGVVLLGANEATVKGLATLELDRSDAFAANGDVQAALCYNVHDSFEGSFAGIYHTSTFNEILKWMATVKASPPPFHKVFDHLSDQGYIVRAAFPNLVLPEILVDPLQHTESLPPAQVAVRLRWYEGKYCRRGKQPILG